MKAYPEKILKLALEMVYLVPVNYTHFDLRKWLGVQKVGKFTFVMRYLNDIE